MYGDEVLCALECALDFSRFFVTPCISIDFEDFQKRPNNFPTDLASLTP